MSMPTDPLPYATPASSRRLPFFHVGIFLWSLGLVVIWMAILIFVLPRFQETYQDYKLELPATTKLLFAARTGVIHGGFVVLLLIPVALGFVSGPLGRGGRWALRIIVTLLFAVVVAITVFGIFQPIMLLITGLTANGGKP